MTVTAMAGVAVCEAVEQVCGVRPGLKWPNDPVMNGEKALRYFDRAVTGG